jgi:hypothetical protein
VTQIIFGLTSLTNIARFGKEKSRILFLYQFLLDMRQSMGKNKLATEYWISVSI